MTVLADQVTIPKAYEAFDADGNLVDPTQADAVKSLAVALVTAMS